jgi:hypothetical protein
MPCLCLCPSEDIVAKPTQVPANLPLSSPWPSNKDSKDATVTTLMRRAAKAQTGLYCTAQGAVLIGSLTLHGQAGRTKLQYMGPTILPISTSCRAPVKGKVRTYCFGLQGKSTLYLHVGPGDVEIDPPTSPSSPGVRPPLLLSTCASIALPRPWSPWPVC